MSIDEKALTAAVDSLREELVAAVVEQVSAGVIPCAQISIIVNEKLRLWRPLMAEAIEAYEAAKSSEQPVDSSDTVGAIFNELARVCREAVPSSSLANLLPSHRLTIANAIAPFLKRESVTQALAMLHSMIDGGEECRGRDSEISDVIRLLEQRQ